MSNWHYSQVPETQHGYPTLSSPFSLTNIPHLEAMIEAQENALAFYYAQLYILQAPSQNFGAEPVDAQGRHHYDLSDPIISPPPMATWESGTNSSDRPADASEPSSSSEANFPQTSSLGTGSETMHVAGHVDEHHLLRTLSTDFDELNAPSQSSREPITPDHYGMFAANTDPESHEWGFENFPTASLPIPVGQPLQYTPLYPSNTRDNSQHYRGPTPMLYRTGTPLLLKPVTSFRKVIQP
ncbi:hypothetical protein PM082_012418 [Marasmius tenuissimus]|nr:hypothetical protein PM082_012418 [Marasmius tenuissimus]